MIVRKFKVTDEEGLEIIFKVYPNHKNLVKVIKDEIDLALETRIVLNSLISDVNKFMDGNTITKLRVKEEQE